MQGKISGYNMLDTLCGWLAGWCGWWAVRLVCLVWFFLLLKVGVVGGLVGVARSTKSCVVGGLFGVVGGLAGQD